MRSILGIAALCLAALSAPATADSFWRDVISSGMTTASTYLTFKDDKLILPARDDASAFVASGGQIRGPHLEAALRQLREDNPGLEASDEELAQAILARHQ
ncbi:DUF2388 domain-containing protein [Zestomonas carbonaria]|uniref:DUF2388 domain-containing protein n=1 Tax=Zestomonas carbonaria TaxID=2762745 RepID=A0A7U7I751_9GAMM|nr:DUF2388 domain-containing protein [Pseudomonas carbonaria]CAD5105835.1 hypothetical protein PSEWESI4_00092 [Pseudomonas carbonaria]